MSDEIEIKFLCHGAQPLDLQQLIKSWPIAEYQEVELKNAYFDSPIEQLRKWKMGLRIRSSEHENTQTIKTAGRVIGGIHQRPEYNVSIEAEHPNLALFPTTIWPENTDLGQLQAQIKVLFSTNFLRKRWVIKVSESTRVELAYDQGEIRADSKSIAIHEVELELLEGEVSELFQFANKIAALPGLRLADVSKAQRGYTLAKSSDFPYSTTSLGPIALRKYVSIESVDNALIQKSFKSWQLNENLLCNALDDEMASQNQHLLRLALALYDSVKACELCISRWPQSNVRALLTSQVVALLNELAPLFIVQQLEYLLENKEHLFRKLDCKQALKELLEQQLASMDIRALLQERIYAPRHTLLVLNLTEQLYSLDNTAASLTAGDDDFSVSEYLSSLLANQWQSNSHIYETSSELDEQQLFLSGSRVSDGLLLAQLCEAWFDDAQVKQFADSWQDLVIGVDELRAYKQLLDLSKSKLPANLHSSIESWYHGKYLSLQKALVFSRQQAVLNSEFWAH